jgi:hypothetical protein
VADRRNLFDSENFVPVGSWVAQHGTQNATNSKRLHSEARAFRRCRYINLLAYRCWERSLSLNFSRQSSTGTVLIPVERVSVC